jgi:hypothetical protein
MATEGKCPDQPGPARPASSVAAVDWSGIWPDSVDTAADSQATYAFSGSEAKGLHLEFLRECLETDDDRAGWQMALGEAGPRPGGAFAADAAVGPAHAASAVPPPIPLAGRPALPLMVFNAVPVPDEASAAAAKLVGIYASLEGQIAPMEAHGIVPDREARAALPKARSALEAGQEGAAPCGPLSSASADPLLPGSVWRVTANELVNISAGLEGQNTPAETPALAPDEPESERPEPAAAASFSPDVKPPLETDDPSAGSTGAGAGGCDGHLNDWSLNMAIVQDIGGPNARPAAVGGKGAAKRKSTCHFCGYNRGNLGELLCCTGCENVFHSDCFAGRLDNGFSKSLLSLCTRCSHVCCCGVSLKLRRLSKSAGGGTLKLPKRTAYDCTGNCCKVCLSGALKLPLRCPMMLCRCALLHLICH